MNRLTPEQQHALDTFRNLYSRRWRVELASAWAKGAEYQYPHGAYLRQIRNNFGPDWLAAYRPGDERVGYLRQVIATGPYISWEIEAPDGGRMHFDLPTKTEARRRAKMYKITLVERRYV